MSIKAYDPDVKICLVHDEKAINHLSEAERSLFDILKEADPSDYTIDGKTQYQRMKLCVNKYTPFEATMYIDVDTLWFPEKKISDLLKPLLAHDFFIGKNGEYDPVTKKKTGLNYTYWGQDWKIVRYHRLKNILPQTVSGVFWFKKSEFGDKVFARALEIYADKKAPCNKWANGKPDEYCFNVALCELGYTQVNTHFVYFDKTSGEMPRETIFNLFWGMAAGGNKLTERVRLLYNDLVSMYHDAFKFEQKRLHVDKIVMIAERRNY